MEVRSDASSCLQVLSSNTSGQQGDSRCAAATRIMAMLVRRLRLTACLPAGVSDHPQHKPCMSRLRGLIRQLSQYSCCVVHNA